MKKAEVFAILVCLLVTANFVFADTFGSGTNQFTIDFVTISGDASSANGTNISEFSPDQTEYKTFTDPGDDYRIGVYEITNSQWNKFKTAYGRVYGSPAIAYSEDSRWTSANVPTNMLTWYEAAQFVNWLNTSTGHQAAYKFTGTQGTSNYTFSPWSVTDKGYDASNPFRNSNAYYFLPTEDEWVKAAYWNGTSLQLYANKPGDTVHQGDGISGTGWNYWDDDYAADPYGPWAVGSGSEELNGTYDMMGNVFEWMEGMWIPGDDIFDAGVIRGGSYNMYNGGLMSCFRGTDYPANSADISGFRVASIPEPTSLLLLALGGLVLRGRK
jgi:formylglycine-generating enzyme required for sulfatase activity